MKKEYKKPEVFIENFEVSEFIAGQCTTYDVGFSPDNCTLGGMFDDAVLFSTSNLNCTGAVDSEATDNNGFCYHIPTGGNKYFGS